jgi:hypothetical protein
VILFSFIRYRKKEVQKKKKEKEYFTWTIESVIEFSSKILIVKKRKT